MENKTQKTHVYYVDNITWGPGPLKVNRRDWKSDKNEVMHKDIKEEDESAWLAPHSRQWWKQLTFVWQTMNQEEEWLESAELRSQGRW